VSSELVSVASVTIGCNKSKFNGLNERLNKGKPLQVIWSGTGLELQAIQSESNMRAACFETVPKSWCLMLCRHCTGIQICYTSKTGIQKNSNQLSKCRMKQSKHLC